MNNIFEVSSLLDNINTLFNKNIYLKDIWIKGEITDLKEAASSGHKYFQLKDEKSLLKCVFFKFLQKRSDIIEDGDFVLMNGEMEIYQPRGDLTLKVKFVKKEGIGDISKEIQNLRKILENEGLFDRSRKRILPKYPKSIAVITSPNSSAWEDIKKTIQTRYPLVKLNLIPTVMQGDNCADDVVNSINYVNSLDFDDIILISRGGGSEEDLMPFNLENIARSIFSSSIPIVTGIGHEDDFTTADMVADHRGLTPTSAAQMIVPNIINIKEYLMQTLANISKHLEFKIQLKSPILKNINDNLDTLYQKNIENYLQEIDRYDSELINNLKNKINIQESKLEYANNSLEIYNIKQMSERGFNLIENIDGKIIKTISDVQINEQIKIMMSDGTLDSIIKSKTKE
jgi:exodeoxyribonuclease VII large subunit